MVPSPIPSKSEDVLVYPMNSKMLPRDRNSVASNK